MSDRILDDYNFEGLRLYEENSPMNRIASIKVKKIFERLFRNTEVNSDNFYFTIFEDENANAFFINKDNTKDKDKNIIAISRGLIETCNNEAELAGIIAHECGHYLWSELLGGKNTIFQERVADLRAIDLLENGGYNPLHHLEISKRIFSQYGRSYSDINFDVHGNSIARIEDIKAYLTKKANEEGYFKEINNEPDEEYLVFKENIKTTYKRDGYDTYLDKCFKRDYGTKDKKQLNTTQILTTLLKELESGNIIHEGRTYELSNIITEMSIDEFKDKDEETTKLCQNIVMKLINLPENVQFRYYNNKVRYIIKTFKLEPFGDFKTQTQNITNFINYKDKEDAIHWAKEINKLEYTSCFLTAFTNHNIPNLKMRGVENIGRKTPIDELYMYEQEITDNNEKIALNRAIHFVENNFLGYAKEKYYLTEYFFDEKGYVTHFGDEAIELNNNLMNKKLIEEFKRSVEQNQKATQDYLEYWDTLALFSQEKDTEKRQELADKLSILIEQKRLGEEFKLYLTAPIDIVQRSGRYKEVSPKIFEDERIQNCIDAFYASESYKYFVRETDHLTDTYQKIAINNDYSIYVEKNPKYKKLYEYYKDACTIMNKTYTSQRSDVRKKIVLSYLEVARFYQENKRDDIACKIYQRVNSLLSNTSTRNDIPKEKEEEENKRTNRLLKECQQKYLYQSSTSKRYIEEHFLRDTAIGRTYLSSYVLDDISYHQKSTILNNVLKVYNIPTNNNVNDITVDVTNRINTDASLEKLWKKDGIIIITKALQDNPEQSFDIKSVMQSILPCENNKNNPSITNILYSAIEKNNSFNQLPLKDKIYVYEVMEEKGLFSEKYANKTEFFKKIVKEITTHPNSEEALIYAEKLLSRQYISMPTPIGKSAGKSNEIEFAKEKDILIDFYAKEKSLSLGIDDGSRDFFVKTNQLADEICAPLEYINWQRVEHRNKFSQSTRLAILRKVSDNIVSQSHCAQMLEEKGSLKISGEQAQEYDYQVRIAENIISALAKSPTHAKATIDFLSSKCDDKSIDKFFNEISKTNDYRKGERISINSYEFQLPITIDKFSLSLVHENFWHSELPARAYIMNRLLKAYSQKDEDLLQLTLDMHFDKTSPHYKDAKQVIHAVHNNLKPYERSLILSALISANQRDENNKDAGGEAIGEGLKTFFENKGPAFVKFGQLLSYLPTLDSEIRKPLAKLRDKADIPTRASFFNLLEETIPQEEIDKIERVDKILGAGSFFITAKITYQGKDKVISLMRPHARELVESGMEVINGTINELSEVDGKYRPLKNIAKQAHISAQSETDIDADYKKFVEATSIYDNLHISVRNQEFSPEVAKWTSYGSGKDNQVYKIMDMAQGQALTSSKMTEKEKHDMAVAYTALELSILLSGRKWDTDRHQGQQNFHKQDNNDYVIGIFDTGAQMLREPTTRDKLMLGELLYGMARASRIGKSVGDYMVEKVKEMDKYGAKLNINTLYIDEVQRGLTALSDIITYQKEIKDDKGKIIQEEKSLTPEEFGDIIGAVLTSKTMDDKLRKMITAKALLNKLRPFRKGWISSLGEGLKPLVSSIKIEEKKVDNTKLSVKRKDKPKEEIDELQSKRSRSKKLGVDAVNLEKVDTQTNIKLAALRVKLASLKGK